MPAEPSDSLLACLGAIRRPDDVEAWVADDGGVSADGVPESYRRAIHDLLAAIGLIHPETGALVSPNAYYFVRSLRHAIRERAFTDGSWRGPAEDACAGLGARLLRLLEMHRAMCVAQPEPMRAVSAIQAIIKARRGDSDVYLMQYDRGAGQFQPLGGKREEGDASNEAALTRELVEELALDGLTPGRDFAIRPLAEHVRSRAVSASLNVITEYDHSFYHLTNVSFPLMTDSDTRWVTAVELARGRTEDGRTVSPLVVDVLAAVLPGLDYSVAHALPDASP
jgi:8-oxo-dGTP pyrophosphatase MutT (NUDIX family)